MQILADEERERKRRLEIEDALKMAEERKRFNDKGGGEKEKNMTEMISIISSASSY